MDLTDSGEQQPEGWASDRPAGGDRRRSGGGATLGAGLGMRVAPLPTLAGLRLRLALLGQRALRHLAFLLGAACLVAVAIDLFSTALSRPMIHDEHQFVAPGALLAQHGLLPYVDYPYFHMPYLPLLYGGLFLFTDHLLLAARLLAALFAVALVPLVFRQGCLAFAGRSVLLRAALAAAGVGLLVNNPLFRQANGLAWNHDGGMLAATLGLLCLCRARRGAHARRDALLGGLCLALATGIRLSFAPLAIPFGVLMLLPMRAARPVRVAGAGAAAEPGAWVRVRWLALGGLLGSLPALALFAAAPDAFLFGNLGYPQLNTQWYAAQGVTTAMSLPGKFSWLFTEACGAPQMLALLFVALSGLLARGVLSEGFSGGPSLPAAASFLCLPFALVGAMAPSPAWPQYYAACIPFLVLIALYATGVQARRRATSRASCGVLLTAGLAAVGFGAPERGDPLLLAAPARWEPEAVHRIGEQIAAHVGDGLVLTETPIFVLEGGARIYDFNATGPFAFRTGPLLSDARRAELGITSHKELPDVLQQSPPDAFLTGADGWLSKPAQQFVQRHEFVPVVLENDFVLFARPHVAHAGALPSPGRAAQAVTGQAVTGQTVTGQTGHAGRVAAAKEKPPPPPPSPSPSRDR